MKVRVILLIAIGFFYQTLSIYIQCLFSDGLLVTCGYDYLTDDWNHKSYLLYAFCLNYAFPMLTVIFFYSQVLYMYYLPCKRLKFKMEQQPLSKATAMSVHYRKTSLWCWRWRWCRQWLRHWRWLWQRWRWWWWRKLNTKRTVVELGRYFS